MLHPAQQIDPDLGHARAVPSKAAATALLELWLESRT
jgi:hypothetical protein